MAITAPKLLVFILRLQKIPKVCLGIQVVNDLSERAVKLIQENLIKAKSRESSSKYTKHFTSSNELFETKGESKVCLL